MSVATIRRTSSAADGRAVEPGRALRSRSGMRSMSAGVIHRPRGRRMMWLKVWQARPDGRRVDDRHELLEVLDEDPVEEGLVAVLERRQADVALEVVALAADVLELQADLLLDRGRCAAAAGRAARRRPVRRSSKPVSLFSSGRSSSSAPRNGTCTDADRAEVLDRPRKLSHAGQHRLCPSPGATAVRPLLSSDSLRSAGARLARQAARGPGATLATAWQSTKRVSWLRRLDDRQELRQIGVRSPTAHR